MKFKQLFIAMALIFGVATGFSITTMAGDSKGIKFPATHRSWDHVRSTVIHDKENPLFGFLSVYANKKALKSNKSGKAYPNGSKIVGVFQICRIEICKDALKKLGASLPAIGRWDCNIRL